MEDKGLHGIALQEMRVEDAALFMIDQHLYKGLSLLVEPCIQGDKGGNAGGLAFLIKTELLDQGLFSHIHSIKSTGFYGTETMAYINIKVGTSTVKWVNTYIRSRPGSEVSSYEWSKIETLCNLEGDKLIMGDINGNVIYSRPTELWRKEGLGSESKTMNQNMKRIGIRLRKELSTAGITDISALGKYMWQPTRCPVDGPKNKLDMISVTARLINQQRAQVTDIFTPTVEPDNFQISDHQMLTMSMKANCTLQINLYHEKETYKLNRLISSHRMQRLYKQKTDELSKTIIDDVDSIKKLQDISLFIVKQLKDISSETVGMRRVKNKIDYRITADHPDIRASRKALMEAKKIQMKHMIEALGPDSHYKQQQSATHTKNLRNAYFDKIRKEYSSRKLKDKDKLQSMNNTDRSKFLHSRIQGATSEKRGNNVKATYATMSFEGRRAVANEPEQIKLLLNSYTHYVSMDTENATQNAEVDRKTKRGVAKFTKSAPKTDEFDRDFKTKIDERVVHIRKETADKIQMPIDNSDKLNKLFTMKELTSALRRLKKKLWKACGSDGIHNWMIHFAGVKFHEALLQMYNRCWEESTYPQDWYETLISYIYKGKGPLHEFTSYRPISLTSTLVNLMKSMILARIAPVISKQLHQSQGGYRTGSGSKEQLWALIEFLEEGLESETPALFCTTDVHKAFDQVYRNGTIYLLYCHGIRGRMLNMLDLWIRNNIATQLWKGHLAPTIHLDANGLRQGCVLSPTIPTDHKCTSLGGSNKHHA